jgi:hypothetical protein
MFIQLLFLFRQTFQKGKQDWLWLHTERIFPVYTNKNLLIAPFFPVKSRWALKALVKKWKNKKIKRNRPFPRTSHFVFPLKKIYIINICINKNM